MEPRHRVLLEKHYQNFVESITDVDRVLDALALGGTLTQSERRELGQKCSSSPEPVDLLLKALSSKERDHFAELCAALEETHPHLHSMLLADTGAPHLPTGKRAPAGRGGRVRRRVRLRRPDRGSDHVTPR